MRIKIVRKLVSSIVGILALAGMHAEAAEGFSLNFDGTTVGGDGDVTNVAGLVPLDGWNNATQAGATGAGGASGIVSPWLDSTGTDFGVSVSWSGDGLTFRDSVDGSGSDQHLMQGGLHIHTRTFNSSVVDISGIPYDNYAIVAYVKGRSDGRMGMAKLDGVEGSEKTFSVLRFFPGVHVESTSNEVFGTYIAWTDLSGANQVVRFQKDDRDTILAGVQVVPMSAYNEATGEVSRRAVYEAIEEFRESKRPDMIYGGPLEDPIILQWIDILWKEGWNAKAGFDLDIKGIRKSWLNGNGSTELLKDLDAFTELVQADGSVGNVRDASWTVLPDVQSVTQDGNRLALEFQNAAAESYVLSLSFFKDGIIHVNGEEEGFFTDGSLVAAPVTVSDEGNRFVIDYVDEDISTVVELSPFSLKVYRGGELVVDQSEFNATGSLADVQSARVRFNADEEDRYIGFGERFDRLEHKGIAFAQWRMGMSQAINNENTPETYKPIAFYVNPVKTVGMFYNHGGLVRWDVEQMTPGELDVSSIGGICDYYLFVGEETDDIYRGYTEITGRIFDVADWVHMPWMGHGFGQENEVENIRIEVEGFAERGIPHGAIYAAGVGPGATSDLYDELIEPLGIRYGSHWGPNLYTHWPAFEAIPESDIPEAFVMREDGSLFVADHGFQTGSAYYDFTAPKADGPWGTRYNVKFCMLDYGEQTPWDAKMYAFPELNGRETHNLYQYFYQKFAGDRMEAAFPGDWMTFSRSATAGNHAQGGFFAGDHNCSMEDLKKIIVGGINFCSSAGVYWGADIGGFIQNPELTEARFTRWLQFGCFSPLMRTHGKDTRSWIYGENMEVTYKYYAWVRAGLLPYVRHYGELATSDGIPIMRALPLEYPNDANAYLSDQYMFGADLLVAPYTEEDEAASREVYLPEGTWFNFFTGEKLAGGQTITHQSVGYRDMPVYAKAGSILPLQIGENSPVLGESYFATTGQELYTGPSFDSYRIYPSEDGTALDVFSQASVSASVSGGNVYLRWIPEVYSISPVVHFEVHDVSGLASVSVNGSSMSVSDSWTEMMATGDQYFYDEAAGVLYVNYSKPELDSVQDIGGQSIPGTYGIDNEVHMLRSSGTGIGGKSDSFTFMSQVREGDVEIVADVLSVENTNAYAKGGVMIRETSDNDAIQVSVYTRPNGKVQMLWRAGIGEKAEKTGWIGDASPKSVKLVRDGDLFTGYYSPDGESWTRLAQVDVSMYDVAQVGLVATSNQKDVLGSATFKEVSVVGEPLGYFSRFDDIGSPALSGEFMHVGAAYFVEDKGGDIWGNSDTFYFPSQPRSGDMEIIARVDNVGSDQTWAKGGVMIRESAAANSPRVFIYTRPNNRVQMQWRTSEGAGFGKTGWFGTNAPKWVKLTRSGNMFTGFYSYDGAIWTKVTDVAVEMVDEVQVGLATTSTVSDLSCLSILSDVTIQEYVPDEAPSVELVTPVANTTFGVGTAITVEASAVDVDGTIVVVEFFAGDVKVGEATEAPYQIAWGDAPAGVHALTALATDNGGNVVTSEAISITVREVRATSTGGRTGRTATRSR